MPLTEITWTDDDDALGGGPANSSGNRSTPPGGLLLAPTGSGALVTLSAATPAPGGTYTLTAAQAIGAGFLGRFGIAPPPPFPPPTSTILGFASSLAIGALTPTAFGAETLVEVAQQSIAPAYPSLEGFFLAADASQLITSITVDGTTLLTSAAAFDGVNVWFWAGQFPIVGAGVKSITIS